MKLSRLLKAVKSFRAITRVIMELESTVSVVFSASINSDDFRLAWLIAREDLITAVNPRVA